jgi:hypothetical protein
MNCFGIAFNSQSNTLYASRNPGVCVVNNPTLSSATCSSNWSSYGSTAFQNNTSVAIDPKTGNVFVGDYGATVIYEFTSSGAAVTSWQGYNVGKTGGWYFFRVTGIAVDSNSHVWVSDGATATQDVNKIEEYDTNGTALNSWTGPGSPWCIAVSPSSGNVYVGDYFTNSVHEYTSNGTPVTTWGGTAAASGVGQGKFKAVSGISIDPVTDNVYVLDGYSGGDNIAEMFTDYGLYLNQWHIPGTYARSICVVSGGVFVSDINNGLYYFTPI